MQPKLGTTSGPIFGAVIFLIGSYRKKLLKTIRLMYLGSVHFYLVNSANFID